MADAEDLKSSGDFSSCGFDSHPGHQFFLLKSDSTGQNRSFRGSVRPTIKSGKNSKSVPRRLVTASKYSGGPNMPLVRISLRQGTSAEYRKAIADGVHRAMVEAIAVPPDDRFQVITEHPPEGLIYDPQFLGVRRSDRIVFVQITLSAGRKPQQKRKFYKRMAEILAEAPGLPPQDLVINLVETSWENWSFGNGEAQYMDS